MSRSKNDSDKSSGSKSMHPKSMHQVRLAPALKELKQSLFDWDHPEQLLGETPKESEERLQRQPQVFQHREDEIASRAQELLTALRDQIKELS